MGTYNTISILSNHNEGSVVTLNQPNLEEEVRIEETLETLEDEQDENKNLINRDLESS